MLWLNRCNHTIKNELLLTFENLTIFQNICVVKKERDEHESVSEKAREEVMRLKEKVLTIQSELNSRIEECEKQKEVRCAITNIEFQLSSCL